MVAISNPFKSLAECPEAVHEKNERKFCSFHYKRHQLVVSPTSRALFSSGLIQTVVVCSDSEGGSAHTTWCRLFLDHLVNIESIVCSWAVVLCH